MILSDKDRAMSHAVAELGFLFRGAGKKIIVNKLHTNF
jgi:hypothetical protein